MNTPTHAPKKLLVFSAFLGVRKTKKVNLMPSGQIPQLVVRTNPLTLVRGIRNPVRQEKNLHGVRE